MPGEPSRLVAEARKRGKPNRAQNANTANANAHAAAAANAAPAVAAAAASASTMAAAHHDAAAAQQSWESNMARIEAGLRQVGG